MITVRESTCHSAKNFTSWGHSTHPFSDKGTEAPLLKASVTTYCSLDAINNRTWSSHHLWRWKLEIKLLVVVDLPYPICLSWRWYLHMVFPLHTPASKHLGRHKMWYWMHTPVTLFKFSSLVRALSPDRVTSLGIDWLWGLPRVNFEGSQFSPLWMGQVSGS